MNNNIRIWDTEQKRFTYNGDFLDLIGKFQWSNDPFEIGVYAESSEIQLGTGMFDKNGKEIFEGDYLQCVGLNIKWYEEVYFKDGSFVFNEWVLWEEFMYATGNELEIIGNNKENPKLKVNE